MKKSIIALMGLFMFVACSEEAFKEADKMTENGNGNEENNLPMAPSWVDPDLVGANVPGFVFTNEYESPFETNRNFNINYHFNNLTNFTVVLKPYVGWPAISDYADSMYASYLSNPSDPNLSELFASGNQYNNVHELDEVHLKPSSSLSYGPSSGTMPLGNCVTLGGQGLPYSNPVAGNYCEWGKIHYFDFAIYAEGDGPDGVPLYSGVLKQKVGFDTDDTTTFPGNWSPIDNLDNIPDLAVMRSNESGELCLVNEPGTTTIPSEFTFTDPSSGTSYTLSFVTDSQDGWITLQ